jgi:hypothetical protein
MDQREAGSDGRATAKPPALQGLNEWLFGHREHDRNDQLHEDGAGCVDGGEQQEAAERDTHEQEHRPGCNGDGSIRSARRAFQGAPRSNRAQGRGA